MHLKKLIILLFLLGTSRIEASQDDPVYEDAVHESLEPNADVEKQVKGDYPPLSRKESLPLGAIQHAWDQPGEEAGVYSVQFNPRQIIRVRLREYMTTTVSLPFWERISSYEVGDEGSYFVKQVNPTTLNVRTHGLVGADTTLTVFGESGQIYGFYLRAEGYNSKNISDIIVHVQSPKVMKQDVSLYQKTDKGGESQDFIEKASIDPAQFDFNYTMAGDSSIAPMRVYTDGIRTWFDYGARIKKGDLPVIHQVIDGVDTPVNVLRQGEKLVAHGTGIFSLKHGTRVTCIYPSKRSS